MKCMMSVSVELICYQNELKYWLAKMSQKKNANEQHRVKISPVN